MVHGHMQQGIARASQHVVQAVLQGEINGLPRHAFCFGSFSGEV
jgi:hypothetical protein